MYWFCAPSMLFPLAGGELRGFPTGHLHRHLIVDASFRGLWPCYRVYPHRAAQCHPSLQACARWSGISRHAPMGLALRPFSACITGKPRDPAAELGLRRIPCRVAITPSSLLKDLQDIVRPYHTRTSMRPQVFTTSRRVALPDASQACFSSVALVGFAPFRGFSSPVAGVVGFNHQVRLSLSRLSALLAGFVVARCLFLQITAHLSSFEKRHAILDHCLGD